MIEKLHKRVEALNEKISDDNERQNRRLKDEIYQIQDSIYNFNEKISDVREDTREIIQSCEKIQDQIPQISTISGNSNSFKEMSAKGNFDIIADTKELLQSSDVILKKNNEFSKKVKNFRSSTDSSGNSSGSDDSIPDTYSEYSLHFDPEVLVLFTF